MKPFVCGGYATKVMGVSLLGAQKFSRLSRGHCSGCLLAGSVETHVSGLPCSCCLVCTSSSTLNLTLQWIIRDRDSSLDVSSTSKQMDWDMGNSGVLDAPWCCVRVTWMKSANLDRFLGRLSSSS